MIWILTIEDDIVNADLVRHFEVRYSEVRAVFGPDDGGTKGHVVIATVEVSDSKLFMAALFEALSEKRAFITAEFLMNRVARNRG